MQSSINITVSNSFIVTYKLKVCGQPITKKNAYFHIVWPLNSMLNLGSNLCKNYIFEIEKEKKLIPFLREIM